MSKKSSRSSCGSLLSLYFLLTVMSFRAAAFIINPLLKRKSQPLQRALFASVTGTAYTCNDPNAPVVTLFTKEGCTLCDKVKDVLKSIQEEQPHSLEQVDITDKDQEDIFLKYKYDIPVLKVNNQFWIKHRIDQDEARNGLLKAREGNFKELGGEPDAGAMEQRQAERERSK
jgi:thiol-disulfide isomerase/thioredoxin